MIPVTRVTAVLSSSSQPVRTGTAVHIHKDARGMCLQFILK